MCHKHGNHVDVWSVQQQKIDNRHVLPDEQITSQHIIMPSSLSSDTRFDSVQPILRRHKWC